MTTLQKTIVAAALTAAIGTGIYAVHHSAELNARIQQLEQQQAPLAAQMQQLQKERDRATGQLADLREENTRLQAGQNQTELLKLRGQVGALRQVAASNAAKTSQPPAGIADMMRNPAMKEYIHRAMSDKMKSLYADFIQESKLTPEQTDQFVQILTDQASLNLARLTATPQGPTNAAAAGPVPNLASQLRALLGDAGAARFEQFSEELPARGALALLNAQLASASLSPEQSASLIKVIKAEPTELTQGILGGPDMAFAGSQADIDAFLQRVAESNQRILQQAQNLLTPDQLTVLDSVLTKAIESRKLQGAAFLQKH